MPKLKLFFKLFLFIKFTRLSSLPTAGENSSGLGLSIVKKYLDLMNGEITCKSEIGWCTKFIVSYY